MLNGWTYINYMHVFNTKFGVLTLQRSSCRVVCMYIAQRLVGDVREEVWIYQYLPLRCSTWEF